MYKKVIKLKEDLHLPMQIGYNKFHSLSPEDKAKYLFIDGYHVRKEDHQAPKPLVFKKKEYTETDDINNQVEAMNHIQFKLPENVNVPDFRYDGPKYEVFKNDWIGLIPYIKTKGQTY